ncbi:GGDEF domain-containing protein [Maridesulfovibrio sp.]|uniref:GGDEF domain-containing protein n=1 Tax=Maridesulfovibrio sp. TaxID=2795000 RepID=UPI002A18B74A|nr:GGDEF domain-containing protein [Maridesulfovibrio sp.]
MKKTREIQDFDNQTNQSSSDESAATTGFFQDLRYLLFPTQDFLHKRYRDYRLNALVIISVCSLIWASLWAWDITVDPIGAANTLWLRLLFIAIGSCSVVFIICKDLNSWIASFVLVGSLSSEAVFIEILTRLNGGLVYGLAGFMYSMLVAVLLFQCFSLRINYAFTLLSSALPHLAGMVGIVQGFPHRHYAMLIWPAAALAAISQTIHSRNYLLRYRLEKKLKNLSNTDPLTGIRNRRYFMPQLEHETRRAARTKQNLSLLLLDIDDFKSINDRYGHPTGDQVICRVAEICDRLSRDIDVVARIGGEEFSILLVGSNLEQAGNVAERIRTQIAKTVMHGPDKMPFNCTASIGIAEFDTIDKTENSLLSRADAALYKAKRTGRNKVMTIPTT